MISIGRLLLVSCVSASMLVSSSKLTSSHQGESDATIAIAFVSGAAQQESLELAESEAEADAASEAAMLAQEAEALEIASLTQSLPCDVSPHPAIPTDPTVYWPWRVAYVSTLEAGVDHAFETKCSASPADAACLSAQRAHAQKCGTESQFELSLKAADADADSSDVSVSGSLPIATFSVRAGARPLPSIWCGNGEVNSQYCNLLAKKELLAPKLSAANTAVVNAKAAFTAQQARQIVCTPGLIQAKHAKVCAAIKTQSTLQNQMNTLNGQLLAAQKAQIAARGK